MPNPEFLRITAGAHVLTARLEWERAPRTCAAFVKLLPFHAQLIQARWSGQAAWVPLGDFPIGIGAENAVHAPDPGELLLYPGGISEVEILVPYGKTRFACKDGELAGNHFLSVIDGGDALTALGEAVLWKGAQPITFSVTDRHTQRADGSASR